MFVWLLAGIITSFGIWYYFWMREQYMVGLTEWVAGMVEAWREKYPDEDISNLRIRVNLEDGKQVLEREEEET